MNAALGTSIEQPAGASIRSSLLILGTSVVAVSLLAVPVAYWWQRMPGAAWAGLAAGICFLTGTGALLITAQCARLRQPAIGMLGAMAVRMVPPMAVCLTLATRGTGRDYIVFVVCLMTYYLTTLAVETWLSVRLVQQRQSPVGGE